MASSQLAAGTSDVSFDFTAVRRWGPTLSERVDGSRKLAVLQRLARVVCRALGRVELTGLADIPSDGPVLLAVNHQSLMDGPLLFGFVPRVVSCIVKVEAFTPGGGRAGRVLIRAAQFPVRRRQIDPAPVRLSLDILNAGGVIGLFPEGTRGDGRVAQARPGVGYLALKTGAVVLPVAVHGSAELVRRRQFRRPSVTVVVGSPIALELPQLGGSGVLNRAAWLAATETIRSALAQLVADTAPRTGSGGATSAGADSVSARPPAA